MWDLDEDSFITLEDENGNEVDFLLLDVFQFEGFDYMALLPLTDEEGAEEEELFFLQAEMTDEGEVYTAIRSMEVYQAVASAYETYAREKAAEAGVAMPDPEGGE